MADVLGDALLTTVADPRAGARRVLGWQLTWPQIGLMVLTATFASLLIIAIFLMIMPEPALAPDEEATEPEGSSLFELVAQSFLTFGAGSLLVYWIGRAFGGAGRLQEVASAIAWFNLLEPGVLALLLIAIALPSPLREVAMLGVAIWTLWIFACIVAEVHGFKSPARVAMATFGLSLGLLLVLSIVLASAGFEAPGAS
ncbi:MAG: YIP1 family protein [Pseudomonadota bacterium]